MVSFRIGTLYSWHDWFALLSKHLQIPTHKIIISLTVLEYVGVEQCPLLYRRTYMMGTNTSSAPSKVYTPGRSHIYPGEGASAHRRTLKLGRRQPTAGRTIRAGQVEPQAFQVGVLAWGYHFKFAQTQPYQNPGKWEAMARKWHEAT